MTLAGATRAQEAVAKPRSPPMRDAIVGPAAGSISRIPGRADVGLAENGLGTGLNAARLQQAQQLYGNRVAQRMVHRFTASHGGSGGLPATVRAPSPRLAPKPLRMLHDLAGEPDRADPAARLAGRYEHVPVDSVPLRLDAPPIGASPGFGEAFAEGGHLGKPAVDSAAPVDDAKHQDGKDVASATGPADSSASLLQAVAEAQTQLIAAHSLRSETQIASIGTAHRQRISGQYGGVRRGLAVQFAQSAAVVQTIVASKSAEVRATSAGMLKSAQAFVMNTVQAADAQVQQVRQTLDGFVEGVSASLQEKVQGVAGQIAGAIHSVPFPDLPGVAQMRAAAAGLVGRAAQMVTGGLTRVRSLIGSALQSGAQLLGSMLAHLRQLANTALTQAAATIRSATQTLSQALSKVATTVIGALRNLFNATVMPMINRMEAKSLQSLGKAQQQAVAAVRANRGQHLQALAAVMHSKAGGGAPVLANSDPAGHGAAALQAIGQEALRNDRSIVQTFEQRSTSILGSIFAALTAGAGRVIQQVGRVAGEAAQAVEAKIREVMQGLTQIPQAVGSFVQSLLQDLNAAVANVVQSVRALVQSPVDQLLQFAHSGLSRITQAVGRFVRNLLSGDFSLPRLNAVMGVFTPTSSSGPITKPRPPGGPITIPGLQPILIILTLVGALVLFVAPQLAAAVVAALAALGLTLSPAAVLVVLGVVAILALILLLLALYLLYRLFKPKPVPAPPPPPPEEITSLTVAESPGARTRTSIGVGEQVFLTHSPGSATWTTTAGTISPSTGTLVILTAPDTAQAVTVAAGTATIAFTVFAPTGVHMDRFAGTGIKHTANHADSGIETLPFLLPDNVNFHNVRYRELNVGAAVSNPGAYSCFAGFGHCRAAAGGACPDLVLTDTVVGGKGTQAVLGDCVYSGDCQQTAPFTPGNITFAIPYEYKVGAGAFHQFFIVNQVSALAADASTLTSDKAGANGTTTVAAGSGSIPQCP